MVRTIGRRASSNAEPMRRKARFLVPSLLALAATSAAPPADAAGLRANLIDARTIKLDGIPKEWPGAMVRLDQAVRGKVGKPDLDAQGLVAYDDTYLYIAADVTDDTLKAGADHLELALGFPGGTVHTVALYPGDPGKTAGSIKVSGQAAQGARIIEAPRSGGYTLEARVPWSAFPQAATLRVGLRGALFAHDADGSAAVEAVAGTAGSSAYAGLPPMATDPEQALADGLLKQKNLLRAAPSYNLTADVAGDALKERVMVYERYLVVLGPGFRKGTQYYFADTEVDAKAGLMPEFQTRDLTGDGQHEIILRKRYGSGGRYREVMQVWQFGKGDTPTPIFQHEVALANDKGSVENDVQLVPDGNKVSIVVRPGQAKNFHAGNYSEPTETSMDPVLLPWGTIRSQSYKYSGGVYQKAREETQPATPPPATPDAARPAKPAAPATPAAPAAPSASCAGAASPRRTPSSSSAALNGSSQTPAQRTTSSATATQPSNAGSTMSCAAVPGRAGRISIRTPLGAVRRRKMAISSMRRRGRGGFAGPAAAAPAPGRGAFEPRTRGAAGSSREVSVSMVGGRCRVDGCASCIAQVRTDYQVFIRCPGRGCRRGSRAITRGAPLRLRPTHHSVLPVRIRPPFARYPPGSAPGWRSGRSRRRRSGSA